MATEAATTTTRPARTRTRAAAASTPAAKPAKAAPKAAAAAKAEPTVTEVTRFTVELEHSATTKSFEKFVFPDDMKGVVVGTVYAPIGTETVKVLVIGKGDAGETAE